MRLSLIVLTATCLAIASLACDSKEGASTANASGAGDGGGSPEDPGGNDGGDGSAGGDDGPALPPTAFLFVRTVAPDVDHLMAFDLATGEERLVTDLRGDGSKGWSIDGFSISPDRKHVVLASLYGPTAEDTATLLATQRVWTFDMNGKNEKRLTPVFKNRGGGQAGWRIDVRDPSYSQDGATVFYDYGEGTFSSGYSRPWFVPSTGESLPSELPTAAPNCPVVTSVAVRPKTGEILMDHVACRGADSGLFLYPATAGGGSPQPLVIEGELTTATTSPRWSADGSFFVFAATAGNIQSLYAFDMNGKQVVPLVQGADGRKIQSGAVSADGNYAVYCVREGSAENLQIADFSVEPPTLTPLTTDGASCQPVF